MSKKQIFGWDLWEQGFASSSGQYMFIIIEKAIKRKKNKKTITRSFVLPLLTIELQAPFIPIESKNEARIISDLLSTGIKLYKIITGSILKEHARLGFGIKYKCVRELLSLLNYYPDLILFSNNKIEIAEIIGFEKDKEYKDLKKRMKNAINSLKKNLNCNFVEYKEY